MASDMMVLRKQRGNPFGVEVRKFGSAVALMMRLVEGDGEFNRVIGLNPERYDRLDEIAAWYHKDGARCRVEAIPYLASEDDLHLLSAKGFRQIAFHSVLWGVPADRPLHSSDGVEVLEVGDSNMAAFAEMYMAYMEGFPLSDAIVEEAKANVAARYRQPGWRLYIATADGQPAAFGVLHEHEGIGSLAGAATLPEFRGRGCQSALLARRIADAAADGCELVVSQAMPGSSSHRNMERAGLRVAYTKAIWEQGQGEGVGS